MVHNSPLMNQNGKLHAQLQNGSSHLPMLEHSLHHSFCLGATRTGCIPSAMHVDNLDHRILSGDIQEHRQSTLIVYLQLKTAQFKSFQLSVDRSKVVAVANAMGLSPKCLVQFHQTN